MYMHITTLTFTSKPVLLTDYSKYITCQWLHRLMTHTDCIKITTSKTKQIVSFMALLITAFKCVRIY